MAFWPFSFVFRRSRSAEEGKKAGKVGSMGDLTSTYRLLVRVQRPKEDGGDRELRTKRGKIVVLKDSRREEPRSREKRGKTIHTDLHGTLPRCIYVSCAYLGIQATFRAALGLAGRAKQLNIQDRPWASHRRPRMRNERERDRTKPGNSTNGSNGWGYYQWPAMLSSSGVGCVGYDIDSRSCVQVRWWW